MKVLTDFFLLCSGANRTILEECPTEKTKYAGIGATIFFTGLFASLSGGYAAFTVFDSILIAVVVGLPWGLMIFNLDRYIVSSMRKEGRFLREVTSALPRLILAILISIVIAKPLEVKIFEKEIQPEIEILEQIAFAEEEKTVKARFTGEATDLHHQADLIRKELLLMTATRDALLKVAREEADGTGGSRRKNLGPIYKIKKADADKAEIERREFETQSRERIAMIEKKILQNDSSQNAALQSLKYSKRNGLAARMEALSILSSKSEPIRLAHWFIMLLFITIETAPVLVKLITRKGPYDNLLFSLEFRFACREIEDVAVSSSTLREKTASLNSLDKEFAAASLDRIKE